ncbi:expressed unknown protein [Seminavis robusta]|uniref:Uncharacterized protein n=1 Tax=Seminavis robusta TaxID=568900 RepID=A0A9N8DP19_9STRA|nr:expressed unknown protein [Seminavis robusta]|eukprot:Sro190_g081870.1 n/a (108) ;mRNA; f:57736-58059
MKASTFLPGFSFVIVDDNCTSHKKEAKPAIASLDNCSSHKKPGRSVSPRRTTSLDRWSSHSNSSTRSLDASMAPPDRPEQRRWSTGGGSSSVPRTPPRRTSLTKVHD